MRNPFSSDRHGHHEHHGHNHDHHHHDRHGAGFLREMMMAGRHHRGGPFGRGGDNDEFSGTGRDGRRGGGRPGRMFGQGDLKLLLLALIEEQPRHGYELIRAIEELCGGTYTPSPGAIYPTLTFLEESGYAAIQQAEEGAKKQYTITSEGRAFLDKSRADVEAVMQRLKLSARMMAKLSVPMALREAMHGLKSALMGHDRNWDTAEVTRVTAIIAKAAADIAAHGERA
jgi:DNA-binding PadR family transcriptional regulator